MLGLAGMCICAIIMTIALSLLVSPKYLSGKAWQNTWQIYIFLKLDFPFNYLHKNS